MSIHGSTNPQVSLVIPTRNRCARLAASLETILALPDRDFEVIILNNASTDGTRDLSTQYPQIRWRHLDENLGAAARNLGVEAARSDVILMLDDDSWPAPGVIDRLADAFATDPKLGAVVCRILMSNDPEQHDAGGAAGTIVNCGGAVRRSAFLSVGGYPHWFDYYAEEYDLCCKILRADWRIGMAGELSIYHERSVANRDNAAMIYRLVRNNIELWSRYAPPERRDSLVENDTDRYQRIARQLGVVDSFSRGMRDGVERARRIGRESVLTSSQFDALFWLDRARQLLRDWADKHDVETLGIWSRGKGCELLMEAAFCAGVKVVAVYDSMLAEEKEDTSPRWRGVPLFDMNPARDLEVDGLLIGTLSPGVAANIERMLASLRKRVSVINPVPWTHLYESVVSNKSASATDKLPGKLRSQSLRLAKKSLR